MCSPISTSTLHQLFTDNPLFLSFHIPHWPFCSRHSKIHSFFIKNQSLHQVVSLHPVTMEKLQLLRRYDLNQVYDLHRQPTEEEIIERVGISPERYQEVMRASKPVLSLHSRHTITKEEFINGITDFDGGDNRRQPALLKLALDDLDSLKPKESLVIRQRYGLDGKGDRTLGEIAGNLNISREMVRKHEVIALMKLKHPARVDYLRRYIV